MIEEYEYNILINPANLFDNSEEVKDFVMLSNNIEEQDAFLQELIKEGLYEYCSIVQNRINSLT